MSDSVRPHGEQPTRLPRPWDSPGKNTGVGCHFLLQYITMKSESEVAQSCLTLVTPWSAAFQAPPSMGFSRQKYWSGVPSNSDVDERNQRLHKQGRRYPILTDSVQFSHSVMSHSLRPHGLQHARLPYHQLPELAQIHVH